MGKELLWGLPQSIVCSSVFVCLSLRSEPLGGEVRLVGRKGERGLSLSGRGGGKGGGGREGVGGEGCSFFNLFIPPPSNSSAPLGNSSLCSF